MTKMQRNPSTGKRMRNPVTGKLMRTLPAVPCLRCVSTPAQVSVTFSGITFIQNGICYACTLRDQSWTDMFNPNQTYILNQIPGQPCSWKKEFSVSVTTNRWNSKDGYCRGGINSTLTETVAQITASVLSGGSAPHTIRTIFSIGARWDIFQGSNTRDVDTCVDTIAPNGLGGTLGCLTSSRTVIGQNGIATISEV